MPTTNILEGKIDDATHAAMNAVGLDIAKHSQIADQLNNAITSLLENVEVTPEKGKEVGHVKKYNVQVGRDARVYYSTNTKDTIHGIMSRTSRRGFACDKDTVWKTEGFDDYENVETVCVTDPDTGAVVASYTEGDGWTIQHV